MKKWIIFLVITVLLFFIWFRIDRVKISNFENGELFFRYFESDLQNVLNESDLHSISKMFNGKLLYSDNPSCGFSESVSIKINDGYEVFCVARDGCGIIYWKNADKYFKLSNAELKQLHSILSGYGFYFPCV